MKNPNQKSPPLVGVVMGSSSNRDVMRHAVKQLKNLGIETPQASLHLALQIKSEMGIP